ncbi:cupin domain-containing protein [Halogeometricum sp. S1BR25-6]|uniref:Cupin domain-containing protein n=1 Tax=Halogeometricum salsisoli TaxID=2950536 RepID=A0ABU2GAF7_9EURY|nr:cupin domain-containing protein [Halogeometricum sp. S1BR25-6]MDS0297456.1 cupin domain-containing protein [Halogeometricum sp. S1BR25-6]
MPRISESDLEWSETAHGETSFKRKKLGSAAGAERLGASLYELPPGAASWPYHYHTGNEEAAYVLSGTGTLRTPDGEEAVRAGDFLAFPADPSGAHRLRNDGDEPLRYLAVSTMRDPDVTVYPDSEKVGVFAGAPPGGDGERVVSGYFERDDAVDYWEGES